MAALEPIREALSSPWLLGLWIPLALLSVGLLGIDLRRKNRVMPGLMKLVWGFTVAYSGPIGLLVYWKTGRQQIARDSLWRRAWRSVAHCYSGCGAGEITGILITVGLLSLSTWWVAGITFALAYVFGFALTVGPLVQEGVPFGRAMLDALYSETPSITVMEVVAIGVDMTLAGEAGMGDILFWASLIVSLTLGLLAAYPVNVLLIRLGVKEGMHDPRHMAEHAS